MADVWRRKKSATHHFYIRSPAVLHPLLSTMPGGPGTAELAPDGLRFTGASSHYWRWDDLDSWYEEVDAVVVEARPGSGGGYVVEVRVGDGLHRWVHLLPQHGVRHNG